MLALMLSACAEPEQSATPAAAGAVATPADRARDIVPAAPLPETTDLAEAAGGDLGAGAAAAAAAQAAAEADAGQ